MSQQTLPKNDISAWFHNEIWLPRLTWAISFQSAVALITTLVASSLCTLDLFHPVASVAGSTFLLFSWRSWLVSIVSGVTIIPFSFAWAQILTVRDEALYDQLSGGGLRCIGYFSLWALLHLLVDVTVALCCFNVTSIAPEAHGIIIYGVIIVSAYSVADFIFRQRYRLKFPVDLDYNAYRKILLYVYERSYVSELTNIARFLIYGMGGFLVTFLIFGWRTNRFLLGTPTTFLEAFWHYLICQPSILWSTFILTASAIVRQNLMVALFDLFLCQGRLLKLLLDDGADVNGVDSLGKTALMHAATLGARSAVQTILTCNRIDVTASDQFGNTPLLLACSSGHDTVARQLLDYLKKTNGLEALRVHLETTNNMGDTALTVALKNGHVECANLLSECLMPLQFVVPSSDLPPLGQESDLLCSLGEALAVEKPILMKYLAYLDLRLLTLQRQPRMQLIFTVSKPGGHPRCWLSIASPMLQTLRSHIKSFQDTNNRLAAAWQSKIEQSLAGRCTPSAIPPRHWNREWKLPNVPGYVPAEGADSRQSLLKIGFTLPAPITALFKSIRPLIERRIWSDLQMELWNIEALGYIITSSYTDDKYGIIQRDLSQMISLLVSLYSESDRYGRLVTSQRIDQQMKTEIDSHLASLRDRLSDTVTTIHNAFGNLDDVQLTDQERVVLKRLVKIM